MKRNKFSLFKVIVLSLLLLMATGGKVEALLPMEDRDKNSIKVYTENHRYWQFKGQPVLLLGGSSNDNIFQQAYNGLDEELDKLVKHGGNYIRCTMSSKDKDDTYPFSLDEQTGLYDLNRWNDLFWEKFEYFLQATQKRDIIVQLEIWETYDFYTRPWHVVDGKTAWARNPFNPVNNINYGKSESGLTDVFETNGQSLINSFFNTVMPISEPFDFKTRPVVLEYQHKFVDKLLSITLKYDHILY